MQALRPPGEYKSVTPGEHGELLRLALTPGVSKSRSLIFFFLNRILKKKKSKMYFKQSVENIPNQININNFFLYKPIISHRVRWGIHTRFIAKSNYLKMSAGRILIFSGWIVMVRRCVHVLSHYSLKKL